MSSAGKPLASWTAQRAIQEARYRRRPGSEGGQVQKEARYRRRPGTEGGQVQKEASRYNRKPEAEFMNAQFHRGFGA